MSYELIFGNKDLSEFGLVWDGEATFEKPPVAFKRISVPNRNGDIFDIENRFENVAIRYRCYIAEDFKNNLANLVDYLTSFKNYQRLKNSYDTNTYRQAVFVNAISPETNGFALRGSVELIFDCMPQQFYVSGDNYTQLKVNPQGNQWADTDTHNMDGVELTANGGLYTLYGMKQTIYAETYTKAITIPSAGQWTITTRIVLPDGGQVGERTYIYVNGRRYPVSSSGSYVSYFHASSATTINFAVEIGQGDTFGTLNTQFRMTLTKSTELTAFENPTLKASRPLIVYENVGNSMKVYMNGVAVLTYTPPTGASDNDGTLYIDCELLDCYLLKSDNTVVRYNQYISFADDYPTLKSGHNTMYTTYGTVNVAPRWWRL